ncbi:MAG: hypothetical protein NTW03_04475, partial [Verrucomicrobia bacterium]|nr:hypothetical protein [Verrucomicrobiota bacterium]
MNVEAKGLAEREIPQRARFRVALLAAFFFVTALAQAITSQTNGGNWSNPATWVGGVVPVATDPVVIAATNATPVIADVNVTCGNLTINTNCQLSIANNITVMVTGNFVASGSAVATGPSAAITTGTGASKLLLAGAVNQTFTGNGTYGNTEISNLVGYVQTPTTVGLTIAPGCTLSVDSGAFLQQANPSQRIIGGGNFLLAAGATLGIRDASGITSSSSDTNGYVRVTGTRTYDSGANYFYMGTGAQTTGTGLPATVNGLIISNAAGVTLSGSVTVSGATAIRLGTLALGSVGSLAVGSSLNLAARGTLDVSGLGASATYTLGSSATLTASGTGTVLGTSAAAIQGGASGTINLGSRPIVLTYDGSHPALYISQGTLSLNGNAFTVNSAAPLALGTYTIIQQASGNVISNGFFSVSGTALGSGTGGFIQTSGTNVNLIVASAQLAISLVNGGANLVAGTGFTVVLQAQGAGGTPFNVVADTAVTLSLAVGTGTLGGTLSGTILAGNNSVTISGVTYTKAESGVVLTATRTSGDNLAAGNSAAFTVSPGAAATLTLTSGNSQSGAARAALASPFVVTVADAHSNPVAGTNVTFAIAAVPGSATGQSLNTTATTTAANGQASSTLTLGNAAGSYTVTATSAGLSGSPVTFTATATANLAVTTVNGGANPTAGTGFSVAVQVQGAGGTPINVVTNTTVTLSLATGTGVLGGTLTGTILAGSNSVTISAVTYTRAESGVVLTATRTSGDILAAGNSPAFTVNAGAAALLLLTSGNNQSGVVGNALASPFVVT